MLLGRETSWTPCAHLSPNLSKRTTIEDTMTLRTSLEAVLRKHYILPLLTQSGCTCETHSAKDPCPMLVDDLLSCFHKPSDHLCESHLYNSCDDCRTMVVKPNPQPSKEALERLFSRHDKKYDSREEWLSAIQDSLMTWATGQRERVWCEHIIWSQGSWLFCQAVDSRLPQGNWEVCPICAAPRPAVG